MSQLEQQVPSAAASSPPSFPPCHQPCSNTRRTRLGCGSFLGSLPRSVRRNKHKSGVSYGIQDLSLDAGTTLSLNGVLSSWHADSPPPSRFATSPCPQHIPVDEQPSLQPKCHFPVSPVKLIVTFSRKASRQSFTYAPGHPDSRVITPMCVSPCRARVCGSS